MSINTLKRMELRTTIKDIMPNVLNLNSKKDDNTNNNKQMAVKQEINNGTIGEIIPNDFHMLAISEGSIKG